MRNISGAFYIIALLCWMLPQSAAASVGAGRPMSLEDIEQWPASATDAALSDDGRWFLFKRKVSRASSTEHLHVQEINGRRTALIENVVTYAIAEKKFIALQADNTLRIRDFTDPGADGLKIEGVAQWSLDPSRRWLAWVTGTSDGAAKLWVRDLQALGDAATVLSTNELLMNLQWAADGKAATVFARETGEAQTRHPGASRLYVIQNAASSSRRIQAIDAREVLPSGHEWDSRELPRWLADRSGLVLGALNEQNAVPVRDGEPWVVVWHGKDIGNPWKRSYEAAAGRVKPRMVLFKFGSDSAQPLTTNEWETLFAPRQPKRFVSLFDRTPYARRGNMTGDQQGDLYAIELRSGKRKLLLPQLRLQNFMSEFWVSPDGERVLFWRDRQFHVYEIQTDVIRNLTAALRTSFLDKFNDRGKIDPPVPARGYRADGEYLSFGWSTDSSQLLLHDGKDLWKISVASGRAKNLTEAAEPGMQWFGRLEVLSEESQSGAEEGIDFSKPVYVTPTDPRTERSGLARIDMTKETVEMLRTGDALFANWYSPALLKARNADVFVHHYERADLAQGYYVSGTGFRDVRRLTGEDVDTHRQQFAWSPGSEVLQYSDSDGQPLKATLYLPAGYEKGRRYPTIVEVYERNSRGRFVFPTPSHFLASRAFYNSNGYAVLRPDLTYEMNDPMVTAAKYVQTALQKAIDSGVVDPERVGLTGTSFGGYETNFIITQTNAFKAAIASAGGANMFRYNLLRGYGEPLSAGSDHDQMRLRGPVDATTIPAFLRNSAFVHADKVRTPLLLINNDADVAVNWQEGLEYFNALRRQDKDVILLQYVGEGHAPPFSNRANDKDLGTRIKQFWDHHLKGAEAPDWMRAPVQNQRLPVYFRQ